jgi:hypothetical protein
MQVPQDVPSSAASARVLVERPPEGLLRGREAAPVWLLAGIAVAALLLAAAFYFTKLRARSKK